MTDLLRTLYNGVVVPAARLALPIGRRASEKLDRGVEAREEVMARWQRAARRLESREPRLWVHAASAGETLQARPLVEAIRERVPGAAIAYSFFSPSAERYVESWDAADAADYLPFDVRSEMRRMVELLRPDGLILVGAEAWPNLVWEATDRDVPVAQVCCRFGASPGRLRWPMRPVTEDLYGRLAAVGAVAEEDRQAVLDLGVAEAAVEVTGDTRVDVTLRRVEEARADPPPWKPPAGRGPVVVAGSTWRADEAAILPALARLRKAHPELLAVIAPHEPTDEALERIERLAEREDLWSVRLSNLEAGPGGRARGAPAIVLVDRVGLLYRLYEIADAAFVGGGFGGAVHNTMEPAAWRVPVVVGPDHGRPHEVEAMRRAGGLAVADSSRALVDAWGGWLARDVARDEAGRAARRTLEELAGAAGRTLDFLGRRGFPDGRGEE
ncbi:MAG: glycosyltransferase N-terminal domain-containing protein [Gemmatimonadota bacterium]|nr:glycosyltransferase N-terminal domain-containing protein [Gemmatimonadota bacterium]